ncbi:beta-1,3-galactosyltransferase 5-like [Lissotriton helveticus]
MQEFLLVPITTDSIIEAIDGSSAPGLDGFSADFTKTYKDLLVPRLVEVYAETLDIGTLPPTFREAVIILLPKPGKDPHLCGSYRQLSLLNTDYKILAKMAKRLVVFTMILLFSCLGILIFALQLNFIKVCVSCFSRRAMLNSDFEADNGTFLLLPDARCQQKPPFLVILVAARPKDVKARTAIRRTWGKDQTIGNKRIAVFFLVGTMAEGERKAEADIAAESLVYRDIIQKNFTDTYFNLTLKTLMGLEWVDHFCPQTKYVMKTDTDMFVNVFYLTELLVKKNRTTTFFTGNQRLHDSPVRNNLSKWYISEEEYPDKLYPPFCSGSGYILSSDVAHNVFTISESVPFLKLEDVFVGMCLQKLNIMPEPLHNEETFFPFKIEFSICKFRKIVTCHYVRAIELLLYWNALERTADEKC